MRKRKGEKGREKERERESDFITRGRERERETLLRERKREGRERKRASIFIFLSFYCPSPHDQQHQKLRPFLLSFFILLPVRVIGFAGNGNIHRQKKQKKTLSLVRSLAPFSVSLFSPSYRTSNAPTLADAILLLVVPPLLLPLLPPSLPARFSLAAATPFLIAPPAPEAAVAILGCSSS